TRGLTKYYGKVRGIRDVTLPVEEGDFFGFIGPNGAGKSTTVRTLPGLVYPTAGEARVPGHDVVRDRLPILREVGYLPSETAFYPGMRVREVPALSAGLRGVDCRDETARERIKKKKPR
ncbi:MAG: ATP-binding cassette domain-containing protein, partial [Clostridia bacterium]|nr:ATP-binding cassette domain-containing protein [Clostridia bacterium]